MCWSQGPFCRAWISSWKPFSSHGGESSGWQQPLTLLSVWQSLALTLSCLSQVKATQNSTVEAVATVQRWLMLARQGKKLPLWQGRKSSALGVRGYIWLFPFFEDSACCSGEGSLDTLKTGGGLTGCHLLSPLVQLDSSLGPAGFHKAPLGWVIL